MKNIQIKTEIKGAFEGMTGFEEIASTKTRPHKSELPEDNPGQNTLSPTYASLFAYCVPGLKCLSVIHIQGQHNATNRGMYDTRIFYDIDAGAIRKCDFKIGEIINSLPKMVKYCYENIGQLDDLLQVKEIYGYDIEKASNLAELILHAIANAEYLLIRVDDYFDWKENGVLENEVAKTLFAAIDLLPKELRPLASFALSIDENYNKFLNDKLIIIYHGNKKDFGYKKKKKQVEWSDLSQNPETTYLEQSEKYRDSALNMMNGATDFFDTNLSFTEILKNLQKSTLVDTKDCSHNQGIEAIKSYEKKLLESLPFITETVRGLVSDFEHQIQQLTLELCEELSNGEKSTTSNFKKIILFVKKRNIAAFLVMAALIISFGGGYKIASLRNPTPAAFAPAPAAFAPSPAPAPAPVQTTLATMDNIEVTYMIKDGQKKLITINPEWLQMLNMELVSFKINGTTVICKTKKINGPKTGKDFYNEIKKAQKN
jgi:hypothetical protein